MRIECYALLLFGAIGSGLGFGQTPDPSGNEQAPVVQQYQTGLAPEFNPDENDNSRVILEAEPPRNSRLYMGAEYVIWWLREGHVPTILTTSAPAFQGIPGTGDTRVVYGDDRLETRHHDRFNGTRLTLGYWLTDEPALALEAGAFFLERDSTYFKAVSNGDTLLALPYVNAVSGLPASKVIAGPSPQGTLAGGFVGYSRVELFGQEASMVALLANGANGQVELLAGMRFLEMRDRLDLTSASHVLPDQSVLLSVTDHFRAHDFFYGGQLGLRGKLTRGRWWLQVRGLAALGANSQMLRAFGDNIYQTPTSRTLQNTGLFVQASNTGQFERTIFDMVYETGFNLGFQITRNFSFFGGYTFLCWVNPIRSGDQVDTTVNLTQAGPAHPQTPWRTNTFWAQGLNLGLEFRW